jgi:Fe-S-cluster-containing dehydrogenase component
VVGETRGGFPDLFLENRSERCNHCENAPCVQNCPTGASYQAGDGTVQIDRVKCTGCKACIASCSYGARYLHPEGFVDKCTFCAHREGSTACAEVCPTACIRFGDLGDPGSEVNRILAARPHKVLQPELGTRPRVYYLT